MTSIMLRFVNTVSTCILAILIYIVANWSLFAASQKVYYAVEFYIDVWMSIVYTIALFSKGFKNFEFTRKLGIS